MRPSDAPDTYEAIAQSMCSIPTVGEQGGAGVGRVMRHTGGLVQCIAVRECGETGDALQHSPVCLPTAGPSSGGRCGGGTGPGELCQQWGGGAARGWHGVGRQDQGIGQTRGAWHVKQRHTGGHFLTHWLERKLSAPRPRLPTHSRESASAPSAAMSALPLSLGAGLRAPAKCAAGRLAPAMPRAQAQRATVARAAASRPEPASNVPRFNPDTDAVDVPATPAPSKFRSEMHARASLRVLIAFYRRPEQLRCRL